MKAIIHNRHFKNQVTSLAASAALGLGCAAAVMSLASTPAHAAPPGFASITATPGLCGDSLPGIVTVNDAGQLLYYRQDRRYSPFPFWPTPDVLDQGWWKLDIIAPGDFNGDGSNDLIARNRDTGALYLYPGNGCGFSPRIQIGSGWQGLQIAPGKFHGNLGLPDLAATFPDGLMRMYTNAGNNAFAPTYPIIMGGWESYTLIPGGDFNRDGKGDLMSIGPDGTLWFYPGSGNGQFPTRTAVGSGWFGLRVTGGVDFDGNGYPDLIAADAAGNLWLYPGLSGLKFGNRQQIGSGWFPPNPVSANAAFTFAGTMITGGSASQRATVSAVLDAYGQHTQIAQVSLQPGLPHLGLTEACWYPTTPLIQLDSSMTGTQLTQVAAHELAHAIQNIVYGNDCLWNKPNVYNQFGGYEAMADCMTQAMTGSTLFLYYKRGGCTASQVNSARMVVNGYKI